MKFNFKKITKEEWLSAITGSIVLSLIITTGSIGLLVSVLYSTIYDFNFPLLPIVSFPENEWFESTHNKFSTINFPYAVLYDELTLSANLTNKKNFVINITPELRRVTDHEEPIKLKNEIISLEPNKSTVLPIRLFLTNEGTNHLHLTVNVSDKNGTFLDKVETETTVRVVSLDSKLQHESNSITLKATIISAIIGSITVVGLGVSLLFINKQNKITMTNFMHNSRPWVSITDEKIAFEKTSDTIVIYLKNYGKSVAIDTHARGLISPTLITINDLENSPELSPTHASMAPTELWNEKIPDTKHLGDLTKMDVYFGLQIDYKYHNKTARTQVIVRSQDFEYIEKKLT